MKHVQSPEAEPDYSAGAAYVSGRYVPAAEATVSALDWGFTRSDVTYDVVHVKDGAFFRLDRHLARFQASMAGLRMKIDLDAEGIAEVLHRCVALAGLRDAYVAMVCTRGVPAPGMPRKPSLIENRFMAYALPWIDVFTPEQQARGAHLIVAKTPRIPADSVDPTIKNYHWGDMVRALQEAEDAGAESAVLLDRDGFVTEGPGWNIFMIKDGALVAPDRGALEGITRGAVFDLCAELGIPAREGRITEAELREADEILTCTTAGGVMPVSRLDGRIYGNDRPGPISARLRELYWAKHAEGWDATPVRYDA
ncbi:branched chain amino acid aminotransferase apoenzyme [Albimonas donghaensis]|uniref:Probable branched-chain-amino-acid aminotransferase n=1 Tax=Albimonas donghaensis TaxID=356660 RepID=A0A1H2YWI1_9RHOB|nr:aminotransferase class IV [Albimonas donghaensis]SDX08929.1 branched chain amino acid aminotransferase apoenzyme [Albimonas donghaensis]